MRHSIKIFVMAFVAMFVFNTVAVAQFGVGGLIKKATQKKDKEVLGKSYSKDGQLMFNGKPVDMTYKEVTVKNWQTGKMETIENPILRGDGKPEQPVTSQKIFEKEANFQDKEMKQKIREAFMSDENFNNRKRTAEDIMKDRKVVALLFMAGNWQIKRDKWENIESRLIGLRVISELTNGLTVAEKYLVNNKYEGGGSYSTTFNIKIDEEYWKAANKPGFWVTERRLVTDWEHKEDADPLKDI